MKRTVFILGAGFSADAGIPMLRNFLNRMVEMPAEPTYRTQYNAEDRAALSQIQRMQQILEQSPFRSDEDGPDNIEALSSVVEFFQDRRAVFAPALNKLARRTIELSTNLSGAACPRGWTAPTNFPIPPLQPTTFSRLFYLIGFITNPGLVTYLIMLSLVLTGMLFWNKLFLI